jgi:hypothetical protein
MISGVFRDTLWNQTIPDALRGRLAILPRRRQGAGSAPGAAPQIGEE